MENKINSAIDVLIRQDVSMKNKEINVSYVKVPEYVFINARDLHAENVVVDQFAYIIKSGPDAGKVYVYITSVDISVANVILNNSDQE